MAVETIGEALSYGWRVTARCAAGKQDGMHRHEECVYRAELDMANAGVDARARLPVVAAGKPLALSALRIARRAAHLHGAEQRAGRRERASDSGTFMQVARRGG
jgi:hypothetical protein